MKSESRVNPGARMIELGREESLALLASAPMGRIGFTQRALPVIRMAAAAACLTAQQMCSDNARMLATARAGLQKIKGVS